MSTGTGVHHANRVAERLNVASRSLPAALATTLVALYCAWMLWLPCFPSEDGPVHVYYATVARSLLAGQSTFAGAFHVAHRFPPYSLHAYLLMWMMAFTSGVTAEKALACIALITAAAGFAYFAKQIGGNAGLVTLAAIPFFANRYLFIGFYGFSIGVGLALLAMGIWSRPDRGTCSRRIAFVAAAWITSFTHPVPYVLMLGYCASDIAVAWLIRTRGKQTEMAKARLADVVTLAFAASAALYIAAYAHSGALWKFYSARELASNLVRIVEVLRLGSVLPLSGNAYQVPLRVVFFGMFAAAGYQAWRDLRDGRFTRAQLALAWGVAVILVIPFAPDQLNGSYVFADRLAVWSVLLIAAAAAHTDIDGRIRPALLAACSATSVFALIVLNAHMLPIARQLDVSRIPVAQGRSAELLLIHHSVPPDDLSYDPYVWAGVRVAERQRAALIDAPWLNLAIMMLKPTTAEKALDDLVNDPPTLSERLRSGGIIVMTRCGQPNPPPESWAQMERLWKAKYYANWKLETYSCFEVLTLSD